MRGSRLRGNDEWYAGVVRGLPLALLMGEGGNLRAGLLVLCSEERCVMRIAAVIRKVVAGALVLSALVLLAACSGNDSLEEAGAYGPPGSPDSDGNESSEKSSLAFAVYDGPAETNAAFAAQGASADSAFTTVELRTTRMIIREGQLSIEVESILEAMDAARAVVEGVGGRVDASRIVGADPDTKYGSVTLRVPSSSFDAVVGELRTLG